MTVAIWVVASIAASLAVIQLVRRLPAWIGVALFVLGPVALTPVWLGAPDITLFNYAKVYSVCAAAVLIQAMKIGRWSERSGGVLLWIVLAINILEAVVADAPRSAATAAAGIMLVLCQAYPRAVSVDRAPPRDLRYDLGGPWIAIYTLWNFAFVVGDSPLGGFALIHLGAPLLCAAWMGASRWAQARAISLAALMILRMTAPVPPFLYPTPGLCGGALSAVLDTLAFAGACVLVLQSARTARAARRRANLVGTVTLALLDHAGIAMPRAASGRTTRRRSASANAAS